MRAMIYLHHFIGKTWILSQCRKPLFTLKEDLSLNKPEAPLLWTKKNIIHVHENRERNFKLAYLSCFLNLVRGEKGALVL